MKFIKLIKVKLPTLVGILTFISMINTTSESFIICSTQLSMKFIKLIKVKLPILVGILTFISMINTTSESLKAREVYTFQLISYYERLKFHAQLS